jgi:ribosomal protein S19
MRSRWKLFPTHQYPPGPRSRPQPALLGNRLRLYNGRSWQLLSVREPMVGVPLALFLPTKRGGAAIHRSR